MWMWIGFLASLATVLVVSRRNLAVGLISGALLLGVITIPLEGVVDAIERTLGDPSILVLALAMGLIPILGGVMKESGQVDTLVENVRLPKRYLLPFSAALMGLLPMPGGALLSAPILEKAGEGVADELKAAINNWYRHQFILVYPLSSALIATTKICDIDIYWAVLWLLPASLLAAFLGYLFLLRRVSGRSHHDRPFSARRLAVPLAVILSAPVIDFGLKRAFSLGTPATLFGVTAALILSVVLCPARPDLLGIIRRMKPWNFALIIIGMFLYLHVFQQSDARHVIADLPLPPLLLAVIAGFGLGFVTGRVQLPASIIVPVYLASGDTITPLVFALVYVSIFFGYIVSPVHPCLAVTCEYFHVSIRTMLRMLAAPTAIVFGLVIVLALAVT